jgi:hypothetical protein
VKLKLHLHDTYDRDASNHHLGCPRSARSGLGRRGRHEMTRLGLRSGTVHPVATLLAEHGIDLDQLSDELVGGRTAAR